MDSSGTNTKIDTMKKSQFKKYMSKENLFIADCTNNISISR